MKKTRKTWTKTLRKKQKKLKSQFKEEDLMKEKEKGEENSKLRALPTEIKNYFQSGFPIQILELISTYLHVVFTFGSGASYWLGYCLNPSSILSDVVHRYVVHRFNFWYLDHIFTQGCDVERLKSFFIGENEENQQKLLEYCFQNSNSYFWQKFLHTLKKQPKEWIKFKLTQNRQVCSLEEMFSPLLPNCNNGERFLKEIYENPSLWKLKNIYAVDEKILDYDLLLQSICGKGNLSCLKWFRKNMKPVFQKIVSRSPLFLMLEKEEEKTKIQSQNENQNTSETMIHTWEMKKYFYIAAENSHFEIIKYFLEKFHCDYFIFKEEMLGVFLFLCKKKNVDILQYLQKKFKFNLVDTAHIALYNATSGGDLSVIEYLHREFNLKREHVVEGASLEGRSAFFFVCENGKFEILRYFRQHLGLKNEDIRENNNFAFLQICECGNLKGVQYVCREFGLTSEEVITGSMEPNQVRSTLPKEKSLWSHCALNAICTLDFVKILKYFHEDKSLNLSLTDIRTRNNEALRIACTAGARRVVRYLHKIGITIDDLRADQNFALRISCYRGDFILIKFFVRKCGVTYDDFVQTGTFTFNENFYSALHVLEFEGHFKIIQYLEKYFCFTHIPTPSIQI